MDPFRELRRRERAQDALRRIYGGTKLARNRAYGLWQIRQSRICGVFTHWRTDGAPDVDDHSQRARMIDEYDRWSECQQPAGHDGPHDRERTWTGTDEPTKPIRTSQTTDSSSSCSASDTHDLTVLNSSESGQGQSAGATAQS